MTTLYILRHGNTFDPGEVVRRIGRRTDLPLSASGRAQATALGAAFAADDVRFDRIIASPLARAQQTAALLASRLFNDARRAPPIETDARLAEIDHGPDEGAPETAGEDRLGRAALDAWASDGVVPDGWRADPAALTAMWRGFFDELAAGPAATALAVTSGGVARFALRAARREDKGAKLRTAAYGVVRFIGGAAIVDGWNIRP